MVFLTEIGEGRNISMLFYCHLAKRDKDGERLLLLRIGRGTVQPQQTPVIGR